MKKNILLIITILSSFTLESCKPDKANTLYNWEEYHVLSGKPLDMDSLFLGRPGSIAYFDGQLGIFDFYDGKMFTWIDLQHKTCQRNTLFGNGPGEFVPPLYLYNDKEPGNIKIFERSKGVYYTYKMDDAIAGTFSAPLRRDSIGAPGNHTVPCGDYYVGNQMSDDKKMFYLLPPDQKTKIRFGSYPGDLKGIDDASILDMMTQCQMSSNREGNVVVAAGYMTDMLSFYKIENSGATLLKEYFSTDADVNIQKNADRISVIPTDNTLQTYIHLCPTQPYLYALYWGTKECERKEQSYIQVFDWKGNFIKGYSIKDRLVSIAIDEDMETLYGLATKDGEPCILVYKL